MCKAAATEFIYPRNIPYVNIKLFTSYYKVICDRQNIFLKELIIPVRLQYIFNCLTKT